MRTITAMFDDRAKADEAVRKLHALGVQRNEVSVHGRDATAATGTTTHEAPGFWESLGNLFLPDEDRGSYAEGIRRGHWLVSAHVEEMHYNKAMDILEDCGALDMDRHESTWKKEGWTGMAGMTGDRQLGDRRADQDAVERVSEGPSSGIGGTRRTGTDAIDRVSEGKARETGTVASGTTSTGATMPAAGTWGDRSARSGTDDETIPIVEEQLRVGKRETGHGRVRVRSYVVEQPVEEQVRLRDEHVSVDRRPVDREVMPGDELFQDRTIEMDEVREEAVVDKRARVVEEVSLHKDARGRTETVSDTVRRTEVEVDNEREPGTTRRR